MGIFSRIFNSDKSGKTDSTIIKFGRFAENFETEEQEELREQADDQYKSGEFKEAYVTFFEYMQQFGGPAVQCEYNQETDELTFSLIQGTKTITGMINGSEVYAQAVVARIMSPNVALMRYLLSECSELAYSKFGIVDGNVIICQRCPIRDMSPDAFKDMLSEVSLTANSAAEFIAREFPGAAQIENSNVVEIPSAEANHKVEYMRAWIKETFELVESTTNEKIRSIIILRLIFKVMYLISPEGALLDKFNAILEIYGEYKPDEDNGTEINYRMLAELEDVIAMSDKEIKQWLYMTYAVFPVLCYRPFMELTEAITNLMKLPMQFHEMRRPDLAVVACEYIIGSQLTRYGVHPLAYELFTVMWRTLNTDYFYGLGFGDIWYDDSQEILAEKKIKIETNAITANFARVYGETFDVENVCFDSLENFAYSFLLEFCNINQITD